MQEFKLAIFIFGIFSMLGCAKKMLSPSDLTLDLQNQIDRNDTIYLENKTYKIHCLIIGSNKTIIGKGHKTQMVKANTSPLNKNEPIFKIVGKNVTIKNISVKGNILDDEGEWNHSFAISTDKGNINNVVIENVHIFDVRGDGIYIGSHNNFTCSDISIKNIKVKNCYRNGISITNGTRVNIFNVTVNHAGLLGIDMEMDPGNKPKLSHIYIDSFEVQSLAILGNHDNLIDNIEIKNGTINGQNSFSTPSFKLTTVHGNGITIRNSKNIFCEKIKMLNQDRFAVYTMKEHGDVYSDKIYFKNITQEKISLKDSIYNSYNFLPGALAVSFDSLTIHDLGKNKSAILGTPETKNLTFKLSNSNISGGYLARYCKIIIDKTNHITEEINVQFLHSGSKVSNSFFKGKINSTHSDFEVSNTKFDFQQTSSLQDVKRVVIK